MILQPWGEQESVTVRDEIEDKVCWWQQEADKVAHEIETAWGGPENQEVAR